MVSKFDNLIRSVRERFSQLTTSPKYPMMNLPKEMPQAGIYLFSEGDQKLYVGRTNNLRKRLQGHLRNSHNQATLAFLLARQKTGKLKASYKPEGSRNHLLQDAEFRAAFDEARQRIMRMQVQFVEEEDAVKQAILEVFAALETNATFNDFKNH